MNSNRNLIQLIFITLISSGLTMVSSFLLARLLSVDDRGAFQWFITVSTYMVTLGSGGVGFSLALSMRNKQYINWQKYISLFLVYTIIISCLSLLFFNITDFHFLFLLNVLLTSLLTITLEKSKIDSNLKIYRILTLQQPIIAVLLYGTSYVVLGTQNLQTVIYLLTILTLIQALFCLYYLAKISSQFKLENEIQPISSKFFFSNWIKQNLLQIFGATTVNLDKFLIVSFLGNYFLGIYTVCIAFDALLTRFLNMLADYYYSGLLNKINRIKQVLIVILLISIASIIFVPLLAQIVVSFFFGNNYADAAPILIWFIVNSILAGLSWLLSQNMLIQGKQLLLFTRQLISILVFVILFFILKEYQLLGVAYALIGASLTRLVISIIYYFKFPVKEIN